jgi:phage baseplate assembly protein W
MAKTQKYGIKFPINVSSEDMTLFDLNHTRAEQVKSEIVHLIFTPQGQRLRRPDFGTRLIQFIFNPNDTQTWGDVVSEIKETVSMWIPDCNVTEVEVAEFEDGLTLYARIKYTLREEDGSIGNYEIISKL